MVKLLGSEARELVIRIAALFAAVLSKGQQTSRLQTGHQAADLIGRAQEFEPYLRGEEGGDTE